MESSLGLMAFLLSASQSNGVIDVIDAVLMPA
jgi:hypothetical protein